MHNQNGDFHLPKGSLYTPFPVPAYQVLGKAKEYQAQKVLLALEQQRCIPKLYDDM
jgi:hypothetical protein